MKAHTLASVFEVGVALVTLRAIAGVSPPAVGGFLCAAFTVAAARIRRDVFLCFLACFVLNNPIDLQREAVWEFQLEIIPLEIRIVEFEAVVCHKSVAAGVVLPSSVVHQSVNKL